MTLVNMFVEIHVFALHMKSINEEALTTVISRKHFVSLLCRFMQQDPPKWNQSRSSTGVNCRVRMKFLPGIGFYYVVVCAQDICSLEYLHAMRNVS